MGDKYILDKPNHRKKHNLKISRIGGLTIGPLLLFFCSILGLIPNWYLYGATTAILLGLIDDIWHLRWWIKLFVQLLIACYIYFLFKDNIGGIIFYGKTLYFEETILFFLYIIWFVGIFNAVNLIDGLDGLAAGYMLILSFGLAFSDINILTSISIVFIPIICSFLIYNQRPAKIFMGDSGSLFFGFHAAVIPILSINTIGPVIPFDITPFLIINSFLIADTTRVFFTRLINKKSPMTADTIHFHHLILQQSGSYLASVFIIFFISIITTLLGYYSFNYTLSENFMITHLVLLFLFILSPPVESYVPLFVKIIIPIYSWNKKKRNSNLFALRTIMMTLLFILLFLSLFINSEYLDFNNWTWQDQLSILLILIYYYFNYNDRTAMYIFQIATLLLFSEVYISQDLNIISKVMSALIIITYLVFFSQRRLGCEINRFSSMDLLLILIVISGWLLSFKFENISFWFFAILLSIWFSLAFIFNRTLFYEKK